jgi:hypothetical protein
MVSSCFSSEALVTRLEFEVVRTVNRRSFVDLDDMRVVISLTTIRVTSSSSIATVKEKQMVSKDSRSATTHVFISLERTLTDFVSRR